MLRRFYSKRKNPIEYSSETESEPDSSKQNETATEGVLNGPEKTGSGIDPERVAQGHAMLENLLGSSLSCSTLKEYKVLAKFYF